MFYSLSIIALMYIHQIRIKEDVYIVIVRRYIHKDSNQEILSYLLDL